MEEIKAVKTCKKCGLAFEGNYCKPCMALYYRERIAADPERYERMKAASREYSRTHPEQRHARRAAFKLANPAKVVEQNRMARESLLSSPERLALKRANGAQYMRDNYENKRAGREAYRAENSAKIVAGIAEWRRANPEAVARHANNRRARKMAVGGVISKGLSDKLFALQKGRCACCGKPLGEKFHLDHILPLALGGSNDDSNIQLLTPRCNAQKNAAHPIDFMQSRGFLL